MTTNDTTMYLIRKGAFYYRPNSQGYTAHTHDAGRYTLEEARSITHPNGLDGPRDGMSYVPAPKEPEPSDVAGRLIAMNRDFKSAALAIAANEVACMAATITRLRVENERLRKERPLTADDMAEALECFWNASIGSAHNQQSSTAMDCASVMSEGFAAVSNRLRELAVFSDLSPKERNDDR